MRRQRLALLGALVGLGGLVGIGLWRSGLLAAATGPPGPPGVALVMSADSAADVELPTIDQLQADPAAVAQALRGKGLLVVTDPTGRCLAVARRAKLDRSALQGGTAPIPALAAAILEGATPKQLQARYQGYLAEGALSGTQGCATLEMLRRQGLINAEGIPLEPGAEPQVGLWQSWAVYVSAPVGDQRRCERLWISSPPPTPAVVEQPPLGGSPLWWAWPYIEADWGDRPPPPLSGTYALADLLEKMGSQTDLAPSASVEAAEEAVVVLAERVPARTLLWAVEVALGLRSHVSEAGRPMAVALDYPPKGDPGGERNDLTPVAADGYYSPRLSAVAPELLPRLERLPSDWYWVGWRYSDLPLLYRNLILEEWQGTLKVYGHKSALPLDLDPEHTYVLWTKAVLVSVGFRLAAGGGSESQFMMPAL